MAKALIIYCECCDRNRADWLVFDSVAVCEVCRQSALKWMRGSGFLLSHPHPFTDEFFGAPGKPHRVIKFSTDQGLTSG